MEKKVKTLINKLAKQESNKKESLLFKPIILTFSSNLEEISTLLSSKEHITVYDELRGQLGELIKSRNPKIKFDPEELDKKITQHIGKKEPHHYGVWVYYPWSNKLVHLLDEEEFIEIRTSRNKYKITQEEQELLRTKKIGVIGLSVGQSVSLSLAIERICGEIIVADFDVIEISNLNRIRTGVHNLEIPKPIIVAREIYEIDPFLKVTCYLEGITENNIDDFFIKNGKLDLVIDECDGLDIKILCRLKAKEYQVPLLQEMSDRGTVDIERFDLHPKRSIMHGYIDHLTIELSKIKELSNEEKIPYLMPMIGLETISSRLKASMLEVGQTIGTWPQLGSDVAFGGGLAASIARKILLGENKRSGRFFFDLDEIIYDKKEDYKLRKKETINREISDWFKNNKSKTNSESLKLTSEIIKDFIKAANTSLSEGNSQPWEWVYKNNELFVFYNAAKSTGVLTDSDREAKTLFGSLAQNLLIKANQMGYYTKIKPNTNPTLLMGSFLFFHNEKKKKATLANKVLTPLFLKNYNKHVSTKFFPKKTSIPQDLITHINNFSNQLPGIETHVFHKKNQLELFKKINGVLSHTIYTNRNTHKTTMEQIRWSANDLLTKQNGISIDDYGFDEGIKTLFKIAKDWSAISHLAKWKKGTLFKSIGERSVEHASALILILAHSEKFLFYAGALAEQIKILLPEYNLSLQTNNTALNVLETHKANSLLKREGKLQVLGNEFKEITGINRAFIPAFLFSVGEGVSSKQKIIYSNNMLLTNLNI